MPTRVDVAAEAVHEEISTAVEKIQTNLHTSDANSDTVHQLPSPLFRDEVQRQEMNYLDGLLLRKKSCEDDDCAMQKSHLSKRGDGADRNYSNHNLQVSKESVGFKQPQIQPPGQSKIAYILSPYDYKDDDEREGHVSQRRSSFQATDAGQKMHTKHSARQNENSPNRCTSLKQPLKQQRNAISRKLQNTISNLIHRGGSKPSKKNTTKRQRRTAVPSRNKRRQMNYKVTQRKIITKMVKLGRKCTQSLTTIKHTIEHSVKQAIRNAHFMLEQRNNNTSCGVIDLSNAREGYSMYMNAKNSHMKEGKGNERGELGTNDEVETIATSQKQPAVPPPNAFFVSTERCYV